jgi:hypothetical protein
MSFQIVRSATIEENAINVNSSEKIFLSYLAARHSSKTRVHAIIPKSLVAGFDGAEVTLNKPIAELGQYRRR